MKNFYRLENRLSGESLLKLNIVRSAVEKIEARKKIIEAKKSKVEVSELVYA